MEIIRKPVFFRNRIRIMDATRIIVGSENEWTELTEEGLIEMLVMKQRKNLSQGSSFFIFAKITTL